MKSVNQMRLTFASRSMNEGFARVAVSAFAAQLDPTIEEMNDIKTAVSEAVTNCIVHAYRDDVGKIYITADVLEGDRIRIKVRDRGCGIPDIEKAREPLFTTAGAERAGLGFAVMETFMNRVQVRSTVGKGTTITLEKQIESRPNKNG